MNARRPHPIDPRHPAAVARHRRSGDWRPLRVTALVASLAFAGLVAAEPSLPPGTLPVPVIPIGPGANIAGNGTAIASILGRTLTVDQMTARAIIDWSSFNIAADAAVRFNQPDRNSAVLNRIHDLNASVIQGKISANGDVYLVNANGIVFDRDSQIDVGGLMASTLGFQQSKANFDPFRNGILTNPAAGENAVLEGGGNGAVVIEAGARITAASGGRVLLAGPSIQNSGTVTAPNGQIIVAAGRKVYLAASQDSQLRGLLVEVSDGGTARNLSGGVLEARRGNVTMVGLAVNQEGRVSATSSVNLNGSIRLTARDTVTNQDVNGISTPQAGRYGRLVLGAGSTTEVRPEVDDKTVVPDAQSYVPGSVELAGATVHLQSQVIQVDERTTRTIGASVVVPAGSITITAKSAAAFETQSSNAKAGVRILLDAGSKLDVAGLTNVAAPASRNQLTVELRGNELRDSPIVRNSPLKGTTVYLDARKGTSIADVGDYIKQIERTVAERSTQGGTITIASEGDTIIRAGATLDVSGGSIAYGEGVMRSTQLITAGGRMVDISAASANEQYTGVASKFEALDTKWGQATGGSADARFTPAYIDGKNAGVVSIVSRTAVLDGTLSGRTTAGLYQTTAGNVPLGGSLVLGDPRDLANAGTAPHFLFGAVTLLSGTARPSLGGGLDIDGVLPAAFVGTTFLDPEKLAAGGVNRLQVYSDGAVRLAAGSRIDFAPGNVTSGSATQTARVTLFGRTVTVAGDIVVPGGRIEIGSKFVSQSQSTVPADYAVTIADGVTIAARGRWSNESLTSPTRGNGALALPNGGRVDITSVGDIVLGTGTRLDVTSGGSVAGDGRFTGGVGGSVTLVAGRDPLLTRFAGLSRLEGLDGTIIQGYGFAGGGSLTVGASRVVVGSARAGDPAETLVLDPALFQGASTAASGGFANYVVEGFDGVRVTAGTRVAPNAAVLMKRSSYRFAGSGADVYSFASPRSTELPSLRPVSNLSLSALGTGSGDVVVESGASLVTDPGGIVTITAGRQLTLDGVIEARGGKVALSITDFTGAEGFNAGQSIWLGAASRIDAGGAFVRTATNNGLRAGTLLDGGTVTVHASRGYVIAASGAVIDVAGVSDSVDVLAPLTSAKGVAPGANPRTTIIGAAGSVVLEAQTGILFDGQINARAGGDTARDGSIAFTLLTPITVAGFPTAERRVVLEDGGAVVPAGLTPGAPVNLSTLENRAFVRSRMISASHADSLALSSPDFVEFRGAVSMTLDRDFSIDARAIVGAADATATIDAGYASLVSTVLQSGTTASQSSAAAAPTAVFELFADLVDVRGPVVLRDIRSAHIESRGDLRLSGTYTAPRDAQSASESTQRLIGSITISGDLTLGGAQIYPTTFSDFTIAANRPTPASAIPTNVVFTGPQAATPATVLSAGGSLTVRADRITNGTRLLAPLGSISLEAVDTVTLATGSVTSVAGSPDVDVPFGRTQLGGREWVYALSSTDVAVVKAPRARQVALAGRSIDVSAGAVIDTSSTVGDLGGDVFAYEFTSGPGGSKDVLDPANAAGAFAIVPNLNVASAPYDHQEYATGADTGVRMGDRITISGSDQVADGTYTVLPARYALLPGALLVTPVKSAASYAIAPGQSAKDLKSDIVSGQLAYATRGGADVVDAAVGTYLIQGADVFRQRSEITLTQGSTFFADATAARPIDAGRIVITPTQSLAFLGTVIATATNGRGGEVDLAAGKIAIDDGVQANDGFVHLGVTALNGLAGQSLLVGGRREVRADGTRLVTVASVVEVRGDGDKVLAGPDLMFAATDRVAFLDGARVTAGGAASTSDLRVAATATGTRAAGAFVRVTTGEPGTLVRDGTPVAGTAGTVNIAAGAVLKALAIDGAARAGTIALDATADTTVGSGAVLSAGRYDLAASRIRVGDGSAASGGGLRIAGDLLGLVSGAEKLVLRSASTIDFAGDVTLGIAGIPDTAAGRTIYGLESLDLVAAGISGSGAAGDTVTLNAGAITFSNTAQAASSAVTTSPVTLQVNANTLAFGAGTKAISGFSASTFAVDQQTAFRGAGALTISGPVTLDSGWITAAAGADQSLVVSGGALSVARRGSATVTPQESAAAALTLAGDAVEFGGLIDMRGGHVTLAANAAGPLTLNAGSSILSGGLAHDFAGKTVTTAGGTVELRANAGGIDMREGALIDVAAASGGDAGAVVVSVPTGRVALNGSLQGAAAAGRLGADFSVDALGIDNFGALNAKLDAGGFRGDRVVRVRSGDLVIAADDSIRASAIRLAADAGNVRIDGVLDTSGATAGGLAVFSARDLTVGATARLLAKATNTGAAGGTVTLGSDRGTLDLAQGSVIDVTGGADGNGGALVLRARRNDAGDDVALSTLGSTVTGARDIVLEGVQVYSGISSLVAAGGGGTGSLGIDTVVSDSAAFIAHAADILMRLDLADDSRVHVRPGVEVRSTGNLALTSDWNLALDADGQLQYDPNTGFAGSQSLAGYLTLRAAGNLTLTRSLSDGFSSVPADPRLLLDPTDWELLSGPSWSYRLTGGADLSAADPSALRSQASVVAANTGDVVVRGLVRTGTGFVEIAAARDFRMTDAGANVYTAGVGDPRSRTAELRQLFWEPELASFFDPGGASGPTSYGTVDFPVYLTDGGHVSVTAQRDAIGRRSSQLVADWLYRRTSYVDDSIQPIGDQIAVWWPRIRVFDQGLATLGGGDLRVSAGRDVKDISASVATSGRREGSATEAPIVTGGGDLTVEAGRDVIRGIYYAGRGEVSIDAGRDVTAGDTASAGLVLALSDASATVVAGRTATVETAFDPTLIAQPIWGGSSDVRPVDQSAVFATMTTRAAVRVTAMTGTAEFRGAPNNNKSPVAAGAVSLYRTDAANGADGLYLLPGTLAVSSVLGDVDVAGSIRQMPASTGNLELLAGGSVRLNGAVTMLESTGTLVPTVAVPGTDAFSEEEIFIAPAYIAHSDPPLHIGDAEPVRIVARTSSIVSSGAAIQLPKMADVVAALDIRNFNLRGQNVASTDVTGLLAGRDVVFAIARDNFGKVLEDRNEIRISGPGTLEILAGRNVDLGASVGVRSRGNLDNPYLPTEGANLVVMAGLGRSADGLVRKPNYNGVLPPFDEWSVGQIAPSGGQTLEDLYQKTGRKLSASVNELGADSYVLERLLAQYPVLRDDRNRLRTALFRSGNGAPGDVDVAKLDPAALRKAFLPETIVDGTSADAPITAAEGGRIRALIDGRADALRAEFASLASGESRREASIRNGFFEDLKLVGRSAGTGSYDAGYDTIGNLFPAAGGAGDINLFFSQIKTETGGAISLFAPNGVINVGLTNTGSFVKAPSNLGIFTLAGGDINSFSRSSFLVNTSRVFTLGGGDITIWSSFGDIDAGKGSKTAASTPPPRQIVDKDGNFQIDLTQSVQGSGIGVLLARDDIRPGDVDLIAPNGTVNAGDAGIRVAGNLSIAAKLVVGADNIRVGGISVGVPAAQSTSLAAGLTGVSNVASDATKAADRVAQLAGGPATEAVRPVKLSFLTVEVLGFGNGPSGTR